LTVYVSLDVAILERHMLVLGFRSNRAGLSLIHQMGTS
jgi:hypothetical protein